MYSASENEKNYSMAVPVVMQLPEIRPVPSWPTSSWSDSSGTDVEIPSGYDNGFGQVMQAKRDLRAAQKERKMFNAHAEEFAKIEYPQLGNGMSFTSFLRWYKQFNRHRIESEIERYKTEMRKKKEAASGNAQLFDLTGLRREGSKLSRELRKYTGTRDLIVGGKKVSAMEWAHKQGEKLKYCSTLLIRKERPDGSGKLMYRFGCKGRNCPICGHFHALQLAREIREEFKAKLLKMEPADLRKGRLVHMVLTVANVEVSKVLKVKDAWREIQKRKDTVYKKKENPYEVWQHAEWGVWKWENTRNNDTGMWHPHLHLLVWVDGWLAQNRANRSVIDGTRRKVKVRKIALTYLGERRIRKPGWWTLMQRAWRTACRKVGLDAGINGSKRVKGGKVQHVGHVMSFPGDDVTIEQKKMNIDALLDGAAEEIAKYVVKSDHLLEIEDPDERIELMSMIHGRQLISGFGGISLSPVPKDSEVEGTSEAHEGDIEAVYRYDFAKREYLVTAYFEWSDKAHKEFYADISDWKVKGDILSSYEQYRNAKEWEGSG